MTPHDPLRSGKERLSRLARARLPVSGLRSVELVDQDHDGGMRVLCLRDPARAGKGGGMKLVVLESPYAGDVERNVAYARAAMRDCLSRGEAPIASHLLYTQEGVLDDDIPGERARGIAAGLEWARVAEAVVFYVDRGWSRGMLAAKERHADEGLPIEYRSLEATPPPHPSTRKAD